MAIPVTKLRALLTLSESEQELSAIASPTSADTAALAQVRAWLNAATESLQAAQSGSRSSTRNLDLP